MQTKRRSICDLFMKLYIKENNKLTTIKNVLSFELENNKIEVETKTEFFVLYINKNTIISLVGD